MGALPDEELLADKQFALFMELLSNGTATCMTLNLLTEQVERGRVTAAQCEVLAQQMMKLLGSGNPDIINGVLVLLAELVLSQTDLVVPYTEAFLDHCIMQLGNADEGVVRTAVCTIHIFI